MLESRVASYESWNEFTFVADKDEGPHEAGLHSEVDRADLVALAFAFALALAATISVTTQGIHELDEREEHRDDDAADDHGQEHDHDRFQQ